MSYTVQSAPQFGAYAVNLTGGTATSGGGVAAIPNPEGVDLLIANAFLLVTANSTGAANLTIGTAASGTVAATSMLPATAMAAAAGSVFNLTYQGTAVGAAVAPQKWGSADYINVAGSASTAGFTGILFVDYFRTA